MNCVPVERKFLVDINFEPPTDDCAKEILCDRGSQHPLPAGDSVKSENADGRPCNRGQILVSRCSEQPAGEARLQPHHRQASVPDSPIAHSLPRGTLDVIMRHKDRFSLNVMMPARAIAPHS